MKLYTILRTNNKDKKRVGRGTGSGHGKTSGRGHKGQNARSGGKRRPGFEGGQTPLTQRVPKQRGFRSLNIKETVNIRSLARFEDGAEITNEILFSKGIIKNKKSVVKIVGKEGLTKKLKTKLKTSKEAGKFFEKGFGDAEKKDNKKHSLSKTKKDK